MVALKRAVFLAFQPFKTFGRALGLYLSLEVPASLLSHVDLQIHAFVSSGYVAAGVDPTTGEVAPPFLAASLVVPAAAFPAFFSC